VDGLLAKLKTESKYQMLPLPKLPAGTVGKLPHYEKGYSHLPHKFRGKVAAGMGSTISLAAKHLGL
jgi:hypothetical protein